MKSGKRTIPAYKRIGSRLRRFGRLSVDGFLASVRRSVLHNPKSPKVREDLSELPPFKSDTRTLNYLDVSNERLTLLYERYKSNTPFLEIVSPLWHDMPEGLNLQRFRSHSGYLWTRESSFRYRSTAHYIRQFDTLGLLRLFGEDEAFGCEVVRLSDGVVLSRDKLDSIMESYYFIGRLGLGTFDRFRVLDIGAGYGRLAHRFTTLFKNAEYYCTDAMPVSTFLCEFYLQYRGVKDAYVIPFDDLNALKELKFDVAVCVHSFAEQTMQSVSYWMQLLDRLKIDRLMVIDNDGRWTTFEPPDNRKSYYFPIVRRHGWALLDARPKYSTFFGNLFGIYPESVYAFFVR